MPNRLNDLTRRSFLRSTALVGAGAATTAIGIAPARAAPVEIQYFYRAAWPTSELYANWLIDEFNKKNGDRIHVTGASVDGETYKTKQTIEISSSDPPDVFYSWEGGRAGEIIKGGFAADLSDYYKKFGWDKSLNTASVSLAKFDGKPYFVPTEIGASVVWYRKDLHDKLGLKVPTTWDEMMANAAKAKAAGIAPFMLSNQKKWPAQFMWSAMMVNKYGLDAYQGLIDNKIPWTDPRAVDITAMMKKLADDGMFIENFNSIDFAPAQVPWAQGKALYWYKGSFILGSFRGDKKQCCAEPIDWFAFPPMGDRKAGHVHLRRGHGDDPCGEQEQGRRRRVRQLHGVPGSLGQEARDRQALRLERLDRPFPALADGAASGQGHGRRRLLHLHACRSRRRRPPFRTAFSMPFRACSPARWSRRRRWRRQRRRPSACGARSRPDRPRSLKPDNPYAGPEGRSPKGDPRGADTRLRRELLSERSDKGQQWLRG